jgi:peptidyl-prolyl cis-trans isomerase C
MWRFNLLARALCVSVLLGFGGLCAAAEPEESAVLATWQDIAVTEADVVHFLAFKRPDKSIAELVASEQVLDQYIQNIIMVRAMAREARQKQLLDTEQIQWQQAYQKDLWAVQALQQNAVAQAQNNANWEALAKETYIAEGERFTAPGEFDAAHILIRFDGRSQADALALANKVYQKANADEDFATLAQEYSEDETTAEKGGELGSFEANKMVPEFSAAVQALASPGDISEPVKTQFGYHIIKLNSKKVGKKHPFAVMQKSIIAQLQKENRGQIISDMLAPLRTKTLDAEFDADNKAEFLKAQGVKVTGAPVQ